MRGIDRLLAGILLAGAVGGVAVFARSSGNGSSAHAVDLPAPPLQHIGAPGTVLFAHTPAPTRVAVGVSGRIQVQQTAPTAPARRITIPQATLRPVAAVQPQVQAPAPPASTPAPTPVPAVAAPVQAPQPTRAVAAVQIAPAQLAPVPSDRKGKGHGRALGHDKQHGHDAPQAVEATVAPAPVPASAPPPTPSDAAVLQTTPVDSRQTRADDGAENGDTTGPGNGHGHAWGHIKGRAKPDGN